MEKNRLEAFSDGVIAIIITIMVLEIKIPHGADLAALRPLIPIALSYLLSFIFLGIYWNNHHHLLQAVRYVNGAVLWANLHLLFWLSLIPFATAWMGENHFSGTPVALYGVILLCCAIALMTTLNFPSRQRLYISDRHGQRLEGEALNSDLFHGSFDRCDEACNRLCPLRSSRNYVADSRSSHRKASKELTFNLRF